MADVNNNQPVLYTLTRDVTLQKVFAAAWLGLYIPTLCIIVPVAHASTTESTVNDTNSTSTADDGFNFLEFLPQSAVSIVAVAAFIGLSVAGAWLAERIYERLSLRDDSSDMSEHTKLILRQRILGMVFTKNLDITKLTGKEKERELVKKYGQLWQYKAAMKRKKRKEDIKKAQEAKRKSSVFSGFFSGDKSGDKSGGDKNTKSPISKKPTGASISEEKTSNNKGGKRNVADEFIAIDIKSNNNKNVSKVSTTNNRSFSPGLKNGKTNGYNNGSNNKKDFTTVKVQDDKEFSYGELQDSSKGKSTRPFSSVKGSNNNMTSSSTNQKTTGAGASNRSMSRPLTAGRSRPITAGASNRTEYKSQGNSVRKEVMKKLALFD